MPDPPPGPRAFAVVLKRGLDGLFQIESEAQKWAREWSERWPEDREYRVVPLTEPLDAEAAAAVKALYQAAREALTNGDCEWHEDEKHDDWRICHEVVSLLDEALNDSALARALAALGIAQEESC